MGFALLVGAIALICAIALLLLNTLRAEQSFTLSRLRSDVATSHDREQALNSELTDVSAPQALALKAQQLGMRYPDVVNYKNSKGKTIGVARSGQPGGEISVNSLTDTPASKAAADVIGASAVGEQIDDPVARAAKAAQKAASDKAAADKKAASEAASKVPGQQQAASSPAGKAAAQKK